jgi:hypothetical protein
MPTLLCWSCAVLDLWPYFAVRDSKPRQPRDPGPYMYVLQEHSGPVLPTGRVFAFRGLLRLAGCSNPPTQGLKLFIYITFVPHRKQSADPLRRSETDTGQSTTPHTQMRSVGRMQISVR